MPGMMDTILNLGLNDSTVESLARKSGNERFAYDSYRRFIQMFSSVVLGMDHARFEHLLSRKKKARRVALDTHLDERALKELVAEFKGLVKKETKKNFPDDPMEQMGLAAKAVFDSWHNERAVTYRNIHKIDHGMGTAVNVQAMVFGNLGEASGTGVAFTRDPGNGRNEFFGEYLRNAQGEDVVAGIRTPQPISRLEEEMPAIYRELESIYRRLEKHYRDMQDIEFTIEEGKLFLLQTRSGKRTALAAVNIACDMVDEGLINPEEAVLRMDPDQANQLLHPRVDPRSKLKPIAKGLPASPGAAVGQVVFDADEAEQWVKDKGRKVILVRRETSPEDVGGMAVSQGILTATGGMTSHAAVVARGMGVCCIVGCGQAHVDERKKIMRIGALRIKEGDYITLNGTTGEVIQGQAPLVKPEMTGNFSRILEWADRYRTLKVRANADTPEDARAARGFGAQGIGLCRTEHMFFGEERLIWVRRMILADNERERRQALARLKPFQKKDFEGIFRAMEGLPVTIRLLDPPLHEFLPKGSKEIRRVARVLRVSPGVLERKITFLHEMNPMLGHRGCRLAISYPEIYEMQTEAIIEAASNLVKRGVRVLPEIMIPLVGTAKELEILRRDVERVASGILRRLAVDLKYLVGTMIEVPRGALTAQEIAPLADFFSFGTNDLTQMTYGFSRDDVEKFLPDYVEKGILKEDPFVSLDQSGVGALIEYAKEKGREAKPGLKIGICGEHGGDPESIAFCHRVGLDYVSCSPFRVPIARLAAGRAAIKSRLR